MRPRETAWPIPSMTGETAPVLSSGRVRRVAAVSDGSLSGVQIMWLFAAHIPLGVALDRMPWLATVHAVAILAAGVWMAATGNVVRLAAVVAYIAGAEVLWRMTEASIFWEFGKYATAGLLLLAMMRKRSLRPPFLPFAYFALLLPSALLTLSNQPWLVARGQLSFNLSGPFALMVCGWFFSSVRLSPRDVRTIFLAAIAPLLAVASVAALGIFSTSELLFSDRSSNFAASGGFGPNQVAGALGFGTLVAFFVALDSTASRMTRARAGLACVWLTMQGALTFSRGGLYMAVGGAGLAACFAARDSDLRNRLVPLAVSLFAVGNYFVLPYLDAFTEGHLTARFQDVELTGRDRLILGDIEVFKQNLLFGVGPGEAREFRGSYTLGAGSVVAVAASNPRARAAHTEFSRMVAEHGLLGLGSILLMAFAAFVNVRRAPDARARAFVAGLSCWSALFMSSYAMRLVAPSFAFAVGFATLLPAVEGAAQARARRRAREGRPLWGRAPETAAIAPPA